MRIIHVHLTGKRKDYYFSTIAAIYDTLTASDVGMTLNTLRHAGLAGGGTVITKKAIIKQVVGGKYKTIWNTVKGLRSDRSNGV